LQILKKLRTKAQNKSRCSLSQILLSTLQEKPKDVNLENKTLTPRKELQNYLGKTNVVTELKKKHVNIDFTDLKIKSVRSEWKIYRDVDIFQVHNLIEQLLINRMTELD